MATARFWPNGPGELRNEFGEREKQKNYQA